MPSLYLIRHGESDANVRGVLAGRTTGVALTDRGRAQAQDLRDMLHGVDVSRVVSSPLQRCLETCAEVFPGVTPEISEGLSEVDYGDWSARELSALSKEPAWAIVQRRPSRMTFPGGENLADMAHRALRTVREIDTDLATEASPEAVWVAVSHGDVIKAILADALGMHLDAFQRIAVAPASLSVVHYGADGAVVQTMGATPGRLPGAPTRTGVGGGNEGTSSRRPRH